MNRKWNFIFFMTFFSLVIISSSHAQEVEHNFLVGPQFTNCDSLKLNGLTIEKAIQCIHAADYRYQQEFKLTRRTGLKGGAFFSCNMEVGFLIINFDEEQFLFTEVSKSDWEAFIATSDPEGYFLEKNESWHQYP
jgi:hypothetical protein